MLISEKLPLTHARWWDGILAYRITDVRHIPGVMNITDGLSQQYEDSPHMPEDGSNWTVSPDWEAQEGITNNVFGISPTQPKNADIRKCLAGESLYLQVINALEEIEGPWLLCSQMCAKHQAS